MTTTHWGTPLKLVQTRATNYLSFCFPVFCSIYWLTLNKQEAIYYQVYEVKPDENNYWGSSKHFSLEILQLYANYSCKLKTSTQIPSHIYPFELGHVSTPIWKGRFQFQLYANEVQDSWIFIISNHWWIPLHGFCLFLKIRMPLIHKNAVNGNHPFCSLPKWEIIGKIILFFWGQTLNVISDYLPKWS